MSWNIKTPGDFINGPLTVAGVTQFNSNVGVGVSPLTKFHISGGASAVYQLLTDISSAYHHAYIGKNGNNLVFGFSSNNGSFTADDKVRITSDGNIGVGTNSPNNNSNRSTITLQGAWGGQIDINVGASNHAQFGTDNFSSGASCRIQSQDAICFKTSGANIGAYLNTNGAFSLQNAVSNANGTGIVFPATQNASTNANTLDDYEEGTWTGTLLGGTANPTTPVTATGTYTKVGRQVTVDVYFNNVNTTGASGPAYVSGLPFTAATRSVGTLFVHSFDLNTGTSTCADISVASVYFNASKTNSAWVDVLHNAGSSRYARLTATYFV